MKVIGFANKFFTLWDVTDHTESSNGIEYVWKTYSFIKNISFDRNVVEETYPGVEIDETLRGHSHSFETAKQPVYNDVDSYRFGKYAGRKIEEVNDCDYLSRYISNPLETSHIDFCAKVLEENGYSVKRFKNGDARVMTKYEIETQEKVNKLHSELKSGNLFTVNMEKNLDETGMTYVNDGLICLNFKDYSVREYNGYPYALPTVNGKGKRVKGKELEITDYEIKNVCDWCVSIIVNKFNIK